VHIALNFLNKVPKFQHPYVNLTDSNEKVLTDKLEHFLMKQFFQAKYHTEENKKEIKLQKKNELYFSCPLLLVNAVKIKNK